MSHWLDYFLCAQAGDLSPICFDLPQFSNRSKNRHKRLLSLFRLRRLPLLSQFSALPLLSCNFMSCNFMPCILVRQFHVLHYHVLHFQHPQQVAAFICNSHFTNRHITCFFLDIRIRDCSSTHTFRLLLKLSAGLRLPLAAHPSVSDSATAHWLALCTLMIVWFTYLLTHLLTGAFTN